MALALICPLQTDLNQAKQERNLFPAISHQTLMSECQLLLRDHRARFDSTSCEQG